MQHTPENIQVRTRNLQGISQNLLLTDHVFLEYHAKNLGNIGEILHYQKEYYLIFIITYDINAK